MDYPFFIKEVASVPESVLSALVECALRQKYSTHPHFSKIQTVTAYIGPKDFSCELGRLVKATLLPLIPMDLSTVDMWEVNKLDAGHQILPHTDIASQSGAQGSKVIKSHKIHIPLVTSNHCYFTHRRSSKLPWVSQTMPAGFAYAYNNYVPHGVNNAGTADRYQMTIRFWDPDWKDKDRLMSLLGIGIKDAYEID